MHISGQMLGLPVLLAVFVTGCGDSASRLAPDVVASVAGRELTTGEVEARANNIAFLFSHRDGSTNRAEAVRAAYSRGYAAHWVEDAVLAAAAAEAKVGPSEDQLAICRKNAFANFRAKGDRSYEDLLASPGFNRELWEDVVRSEALKLAMRDYWVAKFPPEVPANYADDMVRKILAHNAEWGLTNRLQHAKATNVWQRIVSGAGFVDVAKAETELRDEVEDNCEWAVLDDRFLADEPALREWVKAAKPGDVSPPLAADGGILIVRLDRLEEDDGYALSRIFFHLADVRPPASKAEIEADFRRRAAAELFRRKLAELVELAKPRYREGFNQNKEKEQGKE